MTFFSPARSRHRIGHSVTRGPAVAGALVALALSICSFGQMGSARADDTLDAAAGEGRIRLAPRVGGGIAGVVGHTDPFPHFIGLSELGVELSYEAVPWGVWAQGSFLSAGADGAWNTPSVAAGASLRVFGDGVTRASLVLRGGLAYEPWHAASNACNVYLFVPTSCRTFPAQDPNEPNRVAVAPPVTDDDAQMVGVMAGARLELPVKRAYLAIDSMFVPVVNVGGGDPSAAFSFRLAFVFGFRDRKVPSGTSNQDTPDVRHRRY